MIATELEQVLVGECISDGVHPYLCTVDGEVSLVFIRYLHLWVDPVSVL